MIAQIPALVSRFISYVSDFLAQNIFASFKIDTIFSFSLMIKLLHNFVKVLWINKIDIIFIVTMKFLSSRSGQTDSKPVSSC